MVDLCQRGVLPYIKVGSHRRIRRSDLDSLLRPDLTRDQLKALWLHRAVAGRLVREPEPVLAKARANLDQLREIHPSGAVAAWLDHWRAVFEDGTEAVLDALTSRTSHAIELRQNSPFAGVLPESERLAVLAAFAVSWRSEHAA